MHKDQHAFLQFAIKIGALRFGEFVLKSGRHSPYFFNIGQFNTGSSIARLGLAYAQTIIASGCKFDMLYGPAYKGIPLVIATSIALADHYQLDVPYAFNRKEAKDHGEGGIIVGAPLQGKVLIVDDVISSGISIRESINLIRIYHAKPIGVVIALDRQEHKPNFMQTVMQDQYHHTLPMLSIACFTDLIDYLATQPNMQANLLLMKRYQAQYNLEKSYIMNIFYNRTLPSVIFITCLFNSSTAMAVKMYKWVDEQGNIQFTDSIPPEAVNLSRELINSGGVTTEVIERAKTPEEVRQEQDIERLKAESKRLAAEQEAADQVLLRTFRTEDEIRMALNGKLDAIAIQVTVAQNTIRRYQSALADQQYKQAAALERSAKAIPANLKNSIQDTLKRISDTYLTIRQKQQAQQSLRDAFDKDLKRFRILKKLTEQDVVVEETIPKFLENLLPCGEGYACDEAWNRAEAFILKHATTPIQIQGDLIIMAKAPVKDDDISITISKINQKGQPTMLFMDLFCKNNLRGLELCKTQKVKDIRQAYRRDVGGITNQ